jgi:tetraacyldisaccharide 4'-kinase
MRGCVPFSRRGLAAGVQVIDEKRREAAAAKRMAQSVETSHRDLISGVRRGPVASLFRAGLAAIEPLYAAATSLRNRFYDAGVFRVHRASRPVISVGNITTGGTGKTPVVRWLVEKFIAAGRQPAVLLRGYKGGDEQRMLQSQLPQVIVEANANRVDAARLAIAKDSNIDVFVLDDGFQHRRLHRDFNLVLIDASNPFGFDHVLPRGLLREPLGGLARADAFLITHMEMPLSRQAAEILARYDKPVFRCRHVLSNALELNGKKVFVFCGIGNPVAFDRQVEAAGAIRIGSHWFADHHHYTQDDLRMLREISGGAEMLVTTQKDAVKLPKNDLPIFVTELAIQFEEDDESKLLDQITRSIRAC